MNQLQRDKQAILRLLEQRDDLSAQMILLHGGEGLLPALDALVTDGTVERRQEQSRAPVTYRLKGL